ncbi:Transposon Ty3-G Gag-Pol polyprotein [Cucumis melo var. makuwa]|uniref:Transposon Ty3-G Gag-Pol polyprotein n=1 Tax=Cucumis melo var. makuwa TaxID=1194695 RepID=A0A5D3DQS7_CUCMM|nr:Transposon Ty3-G Gag-Pol polyprotein [Cucumis melo var. makuwa]
MKFPSNVENCNAIKSLGWDYCEEEVLTKLFIPEEFFKEEDSYYIQKEVNVVSGTRKFEASDQQTKGNRKNKSSIEESPELELKPLPNNKKYVYLEENDTLSVIVFTQLNVVEEKVLLNMLK